jgi:hypothetical protein
MSEEAYKWCDSDAAISRHEDSGSASPQKARYIPSSGLFGRRTSSFRDYPTGDELEGVDSNIDEAADEDEGVDDLDEDVDDDEEGEEADD